MREKDRDNIFYFCCLIEYLSRRTKNKHSEIIKLMSDDDISQELRDAQVNHCLSFEEVSDEAIKRYRIKNGTYDTVSQCRYEIPPFTSIGKIYSRLFWEIYDNGDDIAILLRKIFSSIVPKGIGNFNSCFYYQSPEYIKACYQAGKILD